MDGEKMVEALDRLSWPSPAALMVRHAARHPVQSINDSLAIALTEEGHKDAIAFGHSLHPYRYVRFFHSPAVRCRETAEGIAKGMSGNGTEVLETKETWSLCAPYLKDERCLRSADKLGKGFMRAWFQGELEEDWISSTREAADMVLRSILDDLGKEPLQGRLTVHVSHDWEILLLREELLGLRFEDTGWADYLDGLLFVPAKDGFEVVWGELRAFFRFADGRRTD